MAAAPNAVSIAFTYDAENRMITANSTITGVVTYQYDGDGRRVRKTVGSVTTTYVYDAMGQLTAEYGAPPTDSGTTYLTADQLGSTRFVSASDGSLKKCYDYLPFGEELQQGMGGRGSCYPANVTNPYPGSPDAESMKFTGKERDAETGLDYFGARYFSSPMGRFTSPDLPFADQHANDPQSWNLYTYVRNNPLKYVDSFGRELRFSGDLDKAKAYACEILGTSDCADRISYNQTTGVVTVNTQGIDLSRNEGAKLLANLTGSANVYELSVGDQIPTAGGPQDLRGLLENLDRNPDSRYIKTDVNRPRTGVDDVVGIRSQVITISGNDLQPARISSILFHELSEAYAKIDGGKQYGGDDGAHREAIQRENLLRQQRPGLFYYNLGGVPQTTFYQILPKGKVLYLEGPSQPVPRRRP